MVAPTASPSLTARKIARAFGTGSTPGKPASTTSTFAFGGSP